MINVINGKEMNVCFIDPNSSFLNVVGYGDSADGALQSAIDGSAFVGDDLQEWVENLEQYFIAADAVAEFEKNGTCRCAFSDDYANVIEKQ